LRQPEGRLVSGGRVSLVDADRAVCPGRDGDVFHAKVLELFGLQLPGNGPAPLPLVPGTREESKLAQRRMELLLALPVNVNAVFLDRDTDLHGALADGPPDDEDLLPADLFGAEHLECDLLVLESVDPLVADLHRKESRAQVVPRLGGPVGMSRE